GTRDVAEAERVEAAAALREGHEQRRQRHPGHHPVAELAEREGEDPAGQRGQELLPQPGIGPLWKTSSALNEERTKTPEYTVGKPNGRARASRDRTAGKPNALARASRARKRSGVT